MTRTTALKRAKSSFRRAGLEPRKYDVAARREDGACVIVVTRKPGLHATAPGHAKRFGGATWADALNVAQSAVQEARQ